MHYYDFTVELNLHGLSFYAGNPILLTDVALYLRNFS
jgi:hypothetical protein